jgi:hypothetical protein
MPARRATYSLKKIGRTRNAHIIRPGNRAIVPPAPSQSIKKRSNFGFRKVYVSPTIAQVHSRRCDQVPIIAGCMTDFFSAALQRR